MIVLIVNIHGPGNLMLNVEHYKRVVAEIQSVVYIDLQCYL